MRTIKLNTLEQKLTGKYLPGLNIVLCDATYGEFTVYVPDSKSVKDVTFLFKKTDSSENAITLYPVVEGQLFDTFSTLTLHTQNETEILSSDNTNYARYSVGTTSALPIVFGNPTNNSTFDSNGFLTFSGGAIAWDDLKVTPASFDRPGISDPSIVAYAVGGGATSSYLWEFNKNNIASFTLQLPHGYKEGTDIRCHVHWTPGARGSAESGNTVGWKVDYSWANIDGTFGAMSTLDLSDTCDGTNHKHQMSPAVAISGTSKTISSMLICNVKRTDTGTDDTWATNTTGNLPFLLEIDFHYQIDTIGSRTVASKL